MNMDLKKIGVGSGTEIIFNRLVRRRKRKGPIRLREDENAKYIVIWLIYLNCKQINNDNKTDYSKHSKWLIDSNWVRRKRYSWRYKSIGMCRAQYRCWVSGINVLREDSPKWLGINKITWNKKWWSYTSHNLTSTDWCFKFDELKIATKARTIGSFIFN